MVDDLRAAWDEASRLDGPLSVFRALEAGEGERLARKAGRADEPLKVLQKGTPDGGFMTTLRAWRAAQRWQQRVGG